MNDLAGLTKFATQYAEAWCSQNPESVAAFYAKKGSVSVNDGPPAKDFCPRITRITRITLKRIKA